MAATSQSKRRTPWLRGIFHKKDQQEMQKKSVFSDSSRVYMVAPGQPVWMERDYEKFSREAYIQNVIAHRCIALITQAAASVKVKAVQANSKGIYKEVTSHPILDLLARPCPNYGCSQFFESIYHYRLISGNAFVVAVAPKDDAPKELHLLRPDRVHVVAGKGGMPMAYRYTVNEKTTNYPVNSLSGFSNVLHIKNFHPVNDWYGLSPIEAAAYSIDQHNQSAAWNQALLQNGARPSGALIVKSNEQFGGSLSEEQYSRIKLQIDEQFSGYENAGRPILLEGGLEWKEMSLTPKDMDFVEAKNSAARDIALAFGVPPQLLGIPGDNTYSNLQEARLSLWEQTVMPLVESTITNMSNWLNMHFEDNIILKPNTDHITALASRNQVMWDRLEKASFLTEDEKRAAVGYGPAKKS